MSYLSNTFTALPLKMAIRLVPITKLVFETQITACVLIIYCCCNWKMLWFFFWRRFLWSFLTIQFTYLIMCNTWCAEKTWPREKEKNSRFPSLCHNQVSIKYVCAGCLCWLFDCSHMPEKMMLLANWKINGHSTEKQLQYK